MSKNFVPDFKYTYGTSIGLGGASAFTISAIIQNDTLSGQDTIFSDWDNSGGNNRHIIFRTDGTALSCIADIGGSQFGGTLGTPALSTATRYHVLVRYNGSELAGWVDGTKCGTTYAPSGSMDAEPSVQNYAIGGEIRATTTGFDGKIAEVAVWNVALDLAEIATLSKRVCPLLVRSASILLYVPLLQAQINDLIGGIVPGTAGTGSVSEFVHPRIFYPSIKPRRRLSTTTAEITPEAIPPGMIAGAS